ncbi:MAG: LptF/LptG family permease, partial [Planctomycetales bacterium]|nr:LptF/LptG family permease [Planctomycetales bacterium]
MHLLTRYILWELMKVFLSALTALTGLVVLVGVAQEAIRQGLGPAPVLRMMPYVLPDALRFSVPATMLLSVCVVYGRMSALNEVVAVKSLGISPMKLIAPALAAAFCISLVAVWLNDIAVWWGRQGVRRVVVQSVEEIAYGMLRTQKSFSDNRFSINVKEVDGRRLVRPTITFFGGGDSP